jgi:hypothetical protein
LIPGTTAKPSSTRVSSRTSRRTHATGRSEVDPVGWTGTGVT